MYYFCAGQRRVSEPDVLEHIDDDNPITDSDDGDTLHGSDEIDSDEIYGNCDFSNIPDDLSNNLPNAGYEDDDDNFDVDNNNNNDEDDADDDDRSSLSSENFDGHSDEINKIKNWAIDFSVPQNCLDGLLSILRRRLLPDLPKSSKTFLGTNKANYKIEEMNDMQNNKGEFVYFGIHEGLKACLNENLHMENNIINIIANFDGMPLSKSGHREFWPILIKIFSIPDFYEPFTVAIFNGTSKPRVEDYLHKFVNELNDLFKNGIGISGKTYRVVLKCIVCDTPARAFIKCTQGQNGKHACERCTTVGITFELQGGVRIKLGKTVYPETMCEKRTDNSFRNMIDKDHHNSISPLTKIIPEIDMISTFVLDSMHLLYLGVMKKLMEFWLDANHAAKLKPSFKSELGRRMKYLTNKVCSEFQRQPRSTQYYRKWKATEFRFFLLYCGPIILHGLLDDKYYKHFLLFHVACRILNSTELCESYRNHAKKYLERFFSVLEIFYGKTSLTINSHNLLHVADDAENMQCNLSCVTSFPFENLLGRIKRRLLRTPYRPLAQVCRRLHEENSRIKCNKKVLQTSFVILKTHQEKIEELKYKESKISVHPPNNVVLLKDKTIFQIEKIINSNDESDVQLIGKIWKKEGSLFYDPIDSSSLSMFHLRSSPSRDTRNFPLNSITKKMVVLKINHQNNGPEKIYAIPLLHM